LSTEELGQVEGCEEPNRLSVKKLRQVEGIEGTLAVYVFYSMSPSSYLKR
jgi:hypothetical protein